MDGDDLKPRKKYSEYFEEFCPFYLSIGMSCSEYWDGDNALPKYYREAFKLKQENVNREAWLQGLYFYDALVSAMSHMSDKKNNHKDYTEKPYDFSPKKQTQEEKVAEAQAQAEVWMKQWVAATQKMFKNKE